MSAVLKPVEQHIEIEAPEPEFEFAYTVNPRENIVFSLGVPSVMLFGFLNMLLAMAYGYGYQLEAEVGMLTMWGAYFTMMIGAWWYAASGE